jgi:CheY-like chemotaxis protein
MNGAGAAVAAIIPQEKMNRALVIDDEVDFHERMTDYFDTRGYSVDLANDLAQAKAYLDANEYQIVLADVNLGDLDVKGDAFVLKYRNFKGARVVVVTGRNVNNIRNGNALKEQDIPVWDKGDQNWGTKLNTLTAETSKARSEKLSGELNDFIKDKLGVSSGNYVVTGSVAAATARAVAKSQSEPLPWEIAVEDMLIGWLHDQKDIVRPFFLIGRQVFSAADMVQQVKQKTDVGKELLGMFVEEVRHSLRLKKNPPGR